MTQILMSLCEIDPAVVKQKTLAVRMRIAEVATSHGRDPNEIRLLAVTKGRSPDVVRAALRTGVMECGESYVSEALGKLQEIQEPRPIWHFIGPIQANKTAAIATHFDWVQSVDRLKIARRLSAQRPPHLRALDLCVQVNLDAETQKAGVAPEDAASLCAACTLLPRLRLRGLMAIPKPGKNMQERVESFLRLHALFRNVQQQLGSPDFAVLSMGMSADFEAAIQAGSTLIRLGTALFGPRPARVAAR